MAKAPLVLNLDETAVAFFHGDVRGKVLVRKRRAGEPRVEPVQRVSRRQLRGYITHVAIIAGNPEVQRVLVSPQ